MLFKIQRIYPESHLIPTDVSDMKPRDKSGGFYAIDPKDTEVFDQYPALVNLALSDELLSGVASYLGEPPILTYLVAGTRAPQLRLPPVALSSGP